MKILTDWWAKFVMHKTKQNEKAAVDVRRRLGLQERKPESNKNGSED